MAKKKREKAAAPGFNKKQQENAENNLKRLEGLDKRIEKVGEGNLTTKESAELKKLRNWREEYGRKITKPLGR